MTQADITRSGPAADILRLLRQRGPQSVKSLERELGVTATAVREQLQRLMAAELITTSKVRRGTGRPAHVYFLSEKAHSLFPQGHDLLLKLLLEQIAVEDGDERAHTLLRAVGERLADEFMGGEQAVELTKQLDMLVTTFAQRGRPIALVEHDNIVALQEWACPYHALAREHSGICEMDQHMVERMLGVKVTLAERMIDGHAGCKFVIEQVTHSGDSSGD